MRADDGVGAHHAVLGRRQVHRPALAAHQAVVALHQLAQHFLHAHAARQRVGMAAIGAEGEVAFAHGAGKTRRHRFLPERKMACSLDQVLQEQVVGALLGFADHDLGAVQFEPFLLADIVVQSGAGLGLRAVLCCRHK